MKYKSDGAGRDSVSRDNGNGTKTTKTFQDSSDKRLFLKTQGKENAPSISSQTVTTEND